MTTHPVLSFALLSSLAAAASAQSVTIDWHWNRASDPFAAPAPAALQPGESARVWLDVSWDAGTIPNVRGLRAFLMDLIATDAHGQWVSSGPGFNGTQKSPFYNFNFAEWGHRTDLIPPTGWNMLGTASWGTYHPATGSLHSIQAGQLLAPGTPIVSSLNPISEIWRGMFTPESYTTRTIVLTGQASAAFGGATLYTRPPGQSWYDVIHVPPGNINFGTLEIPVIPSPSTIALLSLGALLSARRRRRTCTAMA